MTVKVTVTNTGERAGKDVVELYYTAPYIAGEIEKSSVELGAFAKTKELQPGESEEVTLTVPVSDMASYDAYDANHILGLERFDRHCNGQIGLAGTGGTHAKGHSIPADSIQIFLLAQSLGSDGAALDRDRDKILSQDVECM